MRGSDDTLFLVRDAVAEQRGSPRGLIGRKHVERNEIDGNPAHSFKP